MTAVTSLWSTPVITTTVEPLQSEVAMHASALQGIAAEVAELLGLKDLSPLSLAQLQFGPGETQTLGRQDGQVTVVCFAAVAGDPEGISGSILIHDPRAAAGMVTMPGLPWGRPFTVAPVAGAAVAFPSWLSWTMVPLAADQRVTLTHGSLTGNTSTDSR